MTSNPTDSLASGATPIIRYSPSQHRVFAVMGFVVAAFLLAYGVTQGQTTYIAAGGFGLLVVGIFARSARDKLRDTAGIALAREGDLLVGGELNRPLPICETTFEIVPDYEGSWAIVLRSRDTTIALRAGGWRVDGERFVTKAVAERTLLALGLERPPH